MSKLKVLLLIGLAVSMAACSGQMPAKPTAVPTAVPTVVQAPPTVVAPTTVPAQPSGGPPKLDPAGVCQVASTPKPVSNFPTSLPADQSLGSDKAAAVLYEYSDFQ